MPYSLQVLSKKLNKKEIDSEDANWLKVLVRSKSNFNENTLRLIPISKNGDISAIIGTIKSNVIMLDVHTIRFLKKSYNARQAQEWTANNYKVNKIFKF